MNSTDAKPGGGKTKTHWKEWEIGCLIEKTLGGVNQGVIANMLGRTRSACRTMLARLITGEVECSRDADDEALQKLREQNAQQTRGTPFLKQAVEQYRSLARNVEATANHMASISNTVVYLLATKVVEGCIPTTEISRFCPPVIAHEVLKIAARVGEHRKQHAEMLPLDKSETAGGGNGEGEAK